MLECVINISEGRRRDILAELSFAAREHLIDLHYDPHHNRSVFTLAGEGVHHSAMNLSCKAFDLLDIATHQGVHPRLGIVDVVPFVPLLGSTMSHAILARDRFAREISELHSVPVFIYGETRTLPDIRRHAFSSLSPSFGPSAPHPKFGAVAVGARNLLVAYNLYLEEPDIELAKRVAKEVRSPFFRTLGLKVGDEVQVSANLVDPAVHGIMELFLAVQRLAPIARGELVGLAPKATVSEVPVALRKKLGLDERSILETRISEKLTGAR